VMESLTLSHRKSDGDHGSYRGIWMRPNWGGGGGEVVLDWCASVGSVRLCRSMRPKKKFHETSASPSAPPGLAAARTHLFPVPLSCLRILVPDARGGIPFVH
jgi:hypothetical protein